MTQALRISRSIYADASTLKPYKIVGDSEVYRKDSNDNEVYAYDGDDKPIFAKQLACKENEICIYYAKDKDGNEIYPTYSDGREKILIKGKYGQLFPVYAVDKDGLPFYPRNGNGIEYVPINARFIKLSDGELKKPVRSNQSNSIETIMGLEDAIDESVRKEANETYLSNITIARNWQTGNPIYAETSENKVVFPVDKDGNEYYLKDLLGNDYIFNSLDQEIDRYAKRNDNFEFYPRKISQTKDQSPSDFIIRNTYAKTSDNVSFYPLDNFNNEFTIVPDSADVQQYKFPIGYPITNDNFYIVPEAPNFDIKLPYLQIDESSHTHRLYRGDMGYRDILTNIKCTERKSRAPAKIAYGGIELESKSPAPDTPALQTSKPAVRSSSGSVFSKMFYIFLTVAILAIGWFLVWRNKRILPMRYESSSSSSPSRVFV